MLSIGCGLSLSVILEFQNSAPVRHLGILSLGRMQTLALVSSTGYYLILLEITPWFPHVILCIKCSTLLCPWFIAVIVDIEVRNISICQLWGPTAELSSIICLKIIPRTRCRVHASRDWQRYLPITSVAGPSKNTGKDAAAIVQTASDSASRNSWCVTGTQNHFPVTKRWTMQAHDKRNRFDSFLVLWVVFHQICCQIFHRILRPAKQI